MGSNILAIRDRIAHCSFTTTWRSPVYSGGNSFRRLNRTVMWLDADATSAPFLSTYLNVQ